MGEAGGSGVQGQPVLCETLSRNSLLEFYVFLYIWIKFVWKWMQYGLWSVMVSDYEWLGYE